MFKHENSHYDPRKQVILDLEDFIKESILRKEDIIVSIDANVTIQPNTTPIPGSIHHLIDFSGLRNITTTLYTLQETQKGGRCIDSCLVTPNTLPSIQAFGYLPYNRIMSTDYLTLLFRSSYPYTLHTYT